MDIVV
jgi:hypothetical protein